MSMFTVTGKVLALFTQQGRVDPDGVKAPDSLKVQILGELPVPAGGTRVDLVTLTVPAGLDFSDYLNQDVSVPLGFFSPAKNQIIHFIPKGSKITALAT